MADVRERYAKWAVQTHDAADEAMRHGQVVRHDQLRALAREYWRLSEPMARAAETLEAGLEAAELETDR